MYKRDTLIQSAVRLLSQKVATDPSYASQLMGSPAQTIQSDRDLSDEQRAVLRQTLTDEVMAMLQRARPSDRRTRAPYALVPLTVQSTLWVQQVVGNIDVTKRRRDNTGRSGNWQPVRGNIGTGRGYFPGDPSLDPNGKQPALATAGLSGYFFNVFGSDKAHSFAGPLGETLFLLGDTLSSPSNPYDVIARNGASGANINLIVGTSTRQSETGQAQAYTPPNQPTRYTVYIYPSSIPNYPQTNNPFTSLPFALTDMGPQSAPYSGLTYPNPPTSDPTVYIVFRMTDHSSGDTASVLTLFNNVYDIGGNISDPATAFPVQRIMSQRSAAAAGPNKGVFIQTAICTYTPQAGDGSNLSPNVPYVLMFGSGDRRASGSNNSSNVFLAAVPAESPLGGFATGFETVYWTGFSVGGGATWTPIPPSGEPTNYYEHLAQPLTNINRLGDFSVVPVGPYWVMMFDDNSQEIKCMVQQVPWAPWYYNATTIGIAFSSSDGWDSAAATVGNAGGVGFIHQRGSSDGLLGPHLPNAPVNANVPAYGPMLVGSFCSYSKNVNSGQETLYLYYTMVTTIPYYTVLMFSVINLG